MADDLALTIDADTQKAVNAFLKLVDAQAKVDQGAKKNKQSLTGFEKGVQQGMKSMDNFSTSLGRMMVIDPFSILQQGLAAVRQEMERSLGLAKDYNLELRKILSNSGDLKNRKEVDAFVKSLSDTAPDASLQDRIRAFDSVRNQLPQASLNRIKGLTRVSSMAATVGADPGEFGGLVGALANVFPEKDASDIADLAQAARQAAGRKAPALAENARKMIPQLQQAGFSGEQALGFMLSTYQSGQDPEVAKMLANRLTEERELAPLRRGEVATGKVANERKFYAASAKERMDMLRADPALAKQMLGEQGLAFQSILAQDPASFAKMVTDADQSNLFLQDYNRELKIDDPDMTRGREEIKQDLAATNYGHKMAKGMTTLDKVDTFLHEMGGGTWSGLMNTAGTVVTGQGYEEMMSAMGRLHKSLDDNTQAQREANQAGTNPNGSDF